MATASHLGIKSLEGLHSVTIRQKVTGFSNNKYVVLAPDGAVILYAKENSRALNRLFGGKDRAFEINIYDTQDKEVVRLRRPYTFGPDKMDVTLCGSLISVVRQEVTFFKPVLNINDANDRPMLRVKGPMTTSGDADFKLYNTKKQQVGVIAKRWGGLARELFSDADHFEISFPADATVGVKAAIIGTCFLIVSHVNLNVW
ncbi:phospholipid scramblase 3-like [Cydia amplana]|uniref:phospholipid scramblase 3-like n=1 Tax=Cydia amplana TaxID=1869771 RepID=UPI002FE6445F